MPSPGLNLSSVDEAFGERADLYRDVLRIKSTVSTDEIQQAYFNRRDELFQILAKMDQGGVPSDSPQRFQVERQMDGVVMSLRVLGDPDARMKYDSIRKDRVAGRLPPSSEQGFPSVSFGDEQDVPLGTGTSVSFSENSDTPRRRRLKNSLRKAKSMDDKDARSTSSRKSLKNNKKEQVAVVEEQQQQQESEDVPKQRPMTFPERTFSHDDMSRKSGRSSRSNKSSKSHKSSASKRKSRKVTPAREPQDDDPATNPVKQREGDDASVSAGTTLTALEARRSMYEVVKDEIVGVLEDTSRSVEQVFGAFTLQDDEIKAVFGRIDKAKRQMENEFTAVEK